MTMFPPLNTRQQAIVSLAKQRESFQTKDIEQVLGKNFDVERITFVRDLHFLKERGILKAEGKGRSVRYAISPRYAILESIDVSRYFAIPFQERGARAVFNEEIFSCLDDVLFAPEEAARLEKENTRYVETRNMLQRESPAILKREWERLVIELSWKSSEIEGNTYTLLETEALLKDAEFAEGKDRAEAQMILNHKTALDFILQHESYMQSCTVEKIKKIHAMLADRLLIATDFRNHPVGIGGTLYRPLAKESEIVRVMKKLEAVLSGMRNPFAKAFVALVMISYIQPFEDGNKRTARIVANAILHAHGKAMLSYRNVSAVEYKKAILLFYEQNNLSAIKQIFLEQFSFAVENYFL